MGIVNDWLDDHARVQGHRCESIKGRLGGEMVNIRWIDTETGESINAPERTCEWEYDGDDYTWATQCGEYWQFSGHYGPTHNGMKYCCYCGKHLVEASNG